MPDWTKSMQQTFEYYIVDPGTWKDVKMLNNVISCTINRDLETDTLGSATIDINETLGESYVRVYLITIQNGVKERFPLGTFLVQTPSSNYNGTLREVSMDAYTPLIELKENPPPIGYFIPEKENIMQHACSLIDEHMRAPIVYTSNAKDLAGNFVANTDDTWFTFTKDLITLAEYEFALDELGRVLFSPIQDIETLQPVWTYTDNNASILYPELSMNHDLYDIPNVVEVIYTNSGKNFYSRVENNDPNSPISIVNRGRTKLRRVTDPGFSGIPTADEVDEYAEKLLKTLSTVEYSISYSHTYCPVRLGDCIRLNYSRAGITGVKAKVVSQSIRCEPGCPVSEKAIFTTKLWR
jgi:hypothetical protein